MREPLNNQWLSPQLRQLAQETPQPSRGGPAFEVTARGTSSPVQATGKQARQRSIPGKRRGTARRGQPWQYLATLALLLGSAAFSYLAWSEADPGHQLAPDVETAPTTIRAPATATAEGDAREQVNALREQNRQLLHRLRELQTSLETSAAD